MTDIETKSLKVLKRLWTEGHPADPPMEYENISDDPENNLVISVFASSFDHYRVRIPYMHFGNSGGSVKISWPKYQQEVSYLPNTKFFVLSKVIHHELFDILKSYAEKIGAYLVYDLDDNMHEVQPSNYAFDYYNHLSADGLKNINSFEHIVSNCDHVIYSTRELQAYYETLNPNSSVFPNFLDIDDRYKNFEKVDWRKIADEQEVEYNDDSILVGFFGSDSHIDDLDILQESITKIINENKNVIFAILTGQDLISSVLIKKWGLPHKRFLYYKYQNINEYVRYVDTFDIGLAPLQMNYFNMAKSNLKLLEYGALGIPYVASKIANLQRFHVESKQIGGLTCNSNNDWYENINFLINNPEIRKNMGKSLQEYVYNQYDVKHSLVLFSNIFRTINDNHKKYRKKPTILELADSYDNIPHVKVLYTVNDYCPCGSGEKYLSCKNNCYPAWGEVIKEEECQSNN